MLGAGAASPVIYATSPQTQYHHQMQHAQAQTVTPASPHEQQQQFSDVMMFNSVNTSSQQAAQNAADLGMQAPAAVPTVQSSAHHHHSMGINILQ